jgi:hypothetical protein
MGEKLQKLVEKYGVRKLMLALKLKSYFYQYATNTFVFEYFVIIILSYLTSFI